MFRFSPTARLDWARQLWLHFYPCFQISVGFLIFYSNRARRDINIPLSSLEISWMRETSVPAHNGRG